MTREHKLALVVGFGLILFVGILLSDHLRNTTREKEPLPTATASALWSMPNTLEPRKPARIVDSGLSNTPAAPPAPDTVRTQPTTTAIDDSPAVLTLEPAQEPEATLLLSTQRQTPRVEPVVPRAPASGTHTVGDGETLQDISKIHFATTRRWQEIARINNIKNPDRIRTGMRLRLPGVETSRPAPPPPAKTVRTYKVQDGDTLIGIAHKTLGSSTRWVEIKKLNTIQDPTELNVGQSLKIPAR